MDETYVKVKGERFFNKAIGYNGKPEKVTIDKSGANNVVLKSINKTLPEVNHIEIRQIKYLINFMT